MCLRLAGLHISVVFSKQLIHDLPILCMGKKGPFEGHDRPADFNIIMYKKFTDMDSDSALQLTLKETIIVKFWCNAKKNIHKYLERLLNSSPFQKPIYVKS